MRHACLAFLALCLPMGFGCASLETAGVEAYYAGNPQGAEAIYRERLEREPNSRALYLLLLGTVELERGDIDSAQEHFVEATGIMQNFVADGEFRALVGEESAKEYKGDPYEQTMALWYVGLIDYMKGEWRYALPSFKSAALADGGTREERYRSDAASVFLMLGKTYQAIGDYQKAEVQFRDAAGVHTFRETVERVSRALGAAWKEVCAASERPVAGGVAYSLLSEGVSGGASVEQEPVDALWAASESAFARLTKLSDGSKSSSRVLGGEDPNIVSGYIKEIRDKAEERLLAEGGVLGGGPLARVVESFSDAENNLLVFVGLGRGPYKYREGEHGEKAQIARGNYPERYAEVFVGGKLVGRTETAEDIYYQASTRGGRAMDAVLATKSVLKDGFKVMAALSYADALDSSGKDRNGALVEGLVWSALSVATRTEADIRAWETVPDKIQVLGAKVAAGEHTVEVVFFGNGGEIKGMRRRWEGVEFHKGRETIVYVRPGRGGAWSCPRREGELESME